MPRIDPLQLLKCLSVLLSPEGGILSRDEVPRLVNLMTKFSKKLVSKCVYVLILKNTETSLVDMFMAEGGWTLIQTWLQDAAQSGNWDLVKEILGLLLITPVDVERLKMNCLPKLIKNLSRREDLDGVAQLSNQIVQNWLVIVKGSGHNASPAHAQVQPEKREIIEPEPVLSEKKETLSHQSSNSEIVNRSTETKNEMQDNEMSDENVQAIKPSTFYKVSVKDGKQVIKKLSGSEVSTTGKEAKSVSEETKVKENKDLKSSEKDKSLKTTSSSKNSKSSSSSTRDKEKDKDRRKSSSRSSSTRSISSSSTSSSRNKDKGRKDKDKKDRNKSNDSKSHCSSKSSGSSSSSSNSSIGSKDRKDSQDKSKSKEDSGLKEKQAEKDKDTLEKLKPLTIDKLGRIPKKTNNGIAEEKQKENKSKDKDLKKKPSFSILDRKTSGEERSKTVKVFNSKMRSTGLEEEVKPPPPRTSKKPIPSVQLPTIPLKRPSPPREPSTMPPEKKLKIDKIDVPERPGAIKLIPPKPKPAFLQESDMFMDALTASAPKKELKKRKRRLSLSKDTPSSPSSSPAGGDPPVSSSPTSPTTTALGLKNIAPINFYQDTLSEESENNEKTEETKEGAENSQESISNDTPASPTTPTDENQVEEEVIISSKVPRTDGLKGVLLYTKKKGPKRSIQWKTEEDLVEIRYFELDETERVNVTKTFMDMAKMEMSSEREALQMSRKPSNEDNMGPQLLWRIPAPCDQPDAPITPGSKSLEKDIQFAREKTVLPALYFDKRRIPDSPEEPIPEIHQMNDPVMIPLEDPESQEIDLRSTPWPEPKASPPHMEPVQMPPMFQNIPPFNPNFNNMPPPQFPGVPPRFPGPVGPHGPIGPGNFVPSNIISNNIMGPPNIMNPQQEMMNSVSMNPGVFAPNPDGYIGPGNDGNYPLPAFNGPQGPNMNMYGPNNFNHRGGGRGYRRGSGNNGNWVRLNGPGNWKRGGSGGGPRGGRICKNIQNHGYCRNRDNCPFVHPT